MQRRRGATYLLAAAESEAHGKYDLLTTVLHELAHLYGFIEGYTGFDNRIEEEIFIDDIQLSDQNLLPPIAQDDTVTTTQGQTTIIDILANDLFKNRKAGRDDDGIIQANTVQIQTEPINGTVIKLADGTVSYLPDNNFVGEDTFTYVVQDNDGQTSNPATVSITVENAPPTIDDIVLADNIIEGTETTIRAIALFP